MTRGAAIECCSFCGATRDRVARLIRGVTGAMICDVCVGMAQTPEARVVHCTDCGAPAGRCKLMCPSLRAQRGQGAKGPSTGPSKGGV